MIIKRIVAISMISTLSIMLVLLLVGLFIPTKTLEKFSKGNSPDATVVAVDKNGNKIEGATVKVQADGSTVVVDQSGNAIAGASAAASTTTAPASTGTTTGSGTTGGGTTTPPPTSGGGGSTGGGTTTPPPTGGGGVTTPAPTATLTAASGGTTIPYNTGTTLSWSSTNASGCTITPTIGAVGVSGSGKSTGSLTKTTAFTLTCTGGGGSKSATVSVLVAAAPVAACGSGGTCHLSDITGHTTSADCRSAITSGTSGQPAMGAYQITAAFITSHNGQKSGVINTKLCGQVYPGNLRNFTGSHKGPTLSGKTYDGWIANFYIGAYN